MFDPWRRALLETQAEHIQKIRRELVADLHMDVEKSGIG